MSEPLQLSSSSRDLHGCWWAINLVTTILTQGYVESSILQTLFTLDKNKLTEGVKLASFNHESVGILKVILFVPGIIALQWKVGLYLLHIILNYSYRFVSWLKDLTEVSEWYGTVEEITHVTESHSLLQSSQFRWREERGCVAWPFRSNKPPPRIVSYRSWLSDPCPVTQLTLALLYHSISRCYSVFDTFAWNKVDFRPDYIIQTRSFLLVRNENIPRPCAVRCPIDYLVSVFVLFANNLERSYLYVYCRVSNFLSSAT